MLILILTIENILFNKYSLLFLFCSGYVYVFLDREMAQTVLGRPVWCVATWLPANLGGPLGCPKNSCCINPNLTLMHGSVFAGTGAATVNIKTHKIISFTPQHDLKQEKKEMKTGNPVACIHTNIQLRLDKLFTRFSLQCCRQRATLARMLLGCYYHELSHSHKTHSECSSHQRTSSHLITKGDNLIHSLSPNTLVISAMIEGERHYC